MRRAQHIQQIDYTKGIVVHLSGLLQPEGAAADALNVELRKGVLRRTIGVQEFANQNLEGTPRLIDEYPRLDGGIYLCVITHQNFYKWNASTKQFSLIGAYSGTEPRSVSSTIMNDLFIFTDGENPIKKYDGTTYADLGGTPPKARQVESFSSHLILGYTIEDGTAYPQRLRWSDTGNPEVWTGGNSGFIDLVDTPDWIVLLCPLGDRLIVYKERSIWEVIYVGSPNMFIATKLIDGVGSYIPDGVESLGDEHFFVGPDNMYRFDGRNLTEAGDRIRPLVFGYDALTNYETFQDSWLTYIEETEELLMGIPQGNETFPRRAYKYHLPTQSWWARDFSVPVTCIGLWQQNAPPAWNDLQGPWAAQNWKWMGAVSSAEAPLTLFGTTQSGYGRVKVLDPASVQDEGVYPEAWYQTVERAPSPNTRWLEYLVEAKGLGGLELLYSKDAGGTWHSLGLRATERTWKLLKWGLNLTCEVAAFKLKFAEGVVEVRRQAALYEPRVRL